MAGQKSRSHEEIELDLIKTGERTTLVKTGVEASNIAPGKTEQKLSPIPELDPWEREANASSTEFSYSLCSVDKYSTASSSTNSLSESQERGGLCQVVLNCLFCRFYDLCLMLPETCERAAICICPAYMYFSTPVEPVHSTDWNCNCDFDCGLMDACHETGNALSLPWKSLKFAFADVQAKPTTSKAPLLC